ncbi:TIGR02450 family Trp-rich protein [Actimicrobium sp. CCI2.3]|uniref:TIGR02450 family Trp-rich protein n=1 Tax=Actimicrobium sp. CCI2.3 TaxID=3048616 RepID=UPI002AB503BB|nr:TIGR02450 family Trp-rich protein [Actimicrobium sp. CCI2.3]MDY7574101.1 TIGR02450 family Trp-rich protein [Actimicrobium sp. CCI2.3]MEB0023231.1 TIGR02450 family Trp-rich protein [Actimicrobium sp. CCI2.3]
MPISPKKLLLSKWTALTPINREKHFLVSRVIIPEDGSPMTHVDLQAVHSQRTETIAWRDLEDAAVWVIGWK